MRQLFVILLLACALASQTRIVGPACVGKCGMPPDLVEDTPAWLGTDYCVEVYANCACTGAFAAQVLWIGNAQAAGAGVELPLNWAPGCSRWFRTAFKTGATLKANARWCLALPPDAKFIGVEIMLQAIVLRTHCDDSTEILTTRAIGVTLSAGY